MPDITTKDNLIAQIKAERARLMAALDGLSDADLTQPGQNGDLSVKDTLAHIAEWEQQCLGWYRAGQRAELPDFDPAQVDRFNRAIYEKHRDRTLADVRAWFEESYQAMLAAIDAMTAEEIFNVGCYTWTGSEPLLVYLRANTNEHYAEHTDEITRWRQAPA
jgi:uncharacterized protein (TIGR03083 family)